MVGFIGYNILESVFTAGASAAIRGAKAAEKATHILPLGKAGEGTILSKGMKAAEELRGGVKTLDNFADDIHKAGREANPTKLKKVAEDTQARAGAQKAHAPAGTGTPATTVVKGADNVPTAPIQQTKNMASRVASKVIHDWLGNTRFHDPLAKLANSIGLKACFVAGTKLYAKGAWGIGWREIEKITLDDWVLSRDEFNPDGVAEWKPVEELFERLGRVWKLEVEGRSILTTGEHPFYEKTKGWLNAMDLQVGDELLTLEGTWHKVTKIEDTHTYQRVYNFSVADWHTYFVGGEEWAWGLWAHNLCKLTPTYKKISPKRVRLQKVQATITKHSLDTGTGTNVKIRKYARLLGRKTDDAGHVIAKRLGGSGTNKANIFPQLRNINRGAYKAFEGKVAKAVKKKGTAEITVKLVYDSKKPTSRRPTKVIYEVVFKNGDTMKKTFLNY